jgi:hypothetical protein
LTFNTTSLPLSHALQEKRVRIREPLRPRTPVIEDRYLLVIPEIDATLDGRLHYGIFPAIAAEILIGIYSAGQMLTVTRRMPRKKEKPDLEQIVGEDEVWALCIRRPPPGWRLLGRWYDKNIFIALSVWDKHRLAGHYPEAAQVVIDAWGREFGSQQVHRGNNLVDYIDGVIHELA